MSIVGKALAGALPLFPQSVVRKVAGRYVAGETKEAAIALALRLEEQGFVATVDHLGENSESSEEAERFADSYMGLMRAMVEADIERNVSVKLTALGLRIDRERTEAIFSRVVDEAARSDFFVRIDMEDSSVTDATLEIYRKMRAVWPRIGVVLQARLKRTARDAEELAGEAANVRLCKGIYPEREEIALTGREEIRESYLAAARRFLEAKCYVGFATHDAPLIEKVEKEIQNFGAAPADFEFQALLGVPMRAVHQRLRDKGFKVRLYLPFGESWYEYSLRRLRENPKIAMDVARGLLKGKS